MAELDLSNAFNDCVDHLAQGQSLDDCLRRYPQYASTLRPMLEAGLLVRRMHIQPADVLAAQTRVRRRFEDALRAPQPKRTSPVRRFIYALAAILIVAFISIGSLATVSQNSLPGDPLYGVKTFSEGLQQSLLDNDALEANFNQRRIQEIQQLLTLGRSEEVTFSGTITIQKGTNWIIASLPITVPLDIPNATVAHIGDEVNVTARTTELQTLTALTIQIIEPASTPLPTIAIPSQTPSPTSTTTPSLTPAPTATITPHSPTIVPTLAVLPQPTVFTPTECVSTRPNGWVSYPIQPGDTLSALAANQAIPLAELMTINCITDASRIIVGQIIYLPKMPAIAPTTNSNQGSGGINPVNPNPTDDHGGDDHGGGDNSGHGGGGGNDGSSGSGGGSDDGSGHT